MKTRHIAISILATSLLAACGGGGGGGGGGSAPPASASVSGTTAKGIIQNAIVTAYSISNGSKGSALATTHTASNGSYSLPLGSYSGPVLLELTVDSNTTMICDVPAGCGSAAFGEPTSLPGGFILRSSLPQASGSTSAAITPFTDLATQLAEANGLTATAIDTYMTQVADLFDLPPLTSTQPIDITGTAVSATPATVDAQRYSLLSAAIGQMAGGDPSQISTVINSLATELVSNSGQLVVHSSDAAKTDLESLLQAASDVAGAPAVASALDPLVAVIVNESLTTALASSPDTLSSASGDNSNATGLASVKAFVTQAHDLVQSIVAADNATVNAEVNAKLAKVTLLQDDSTAFWPLSKTLCVSASVMNYLAQEITVNGSANTTLDASELGALPSDVVGCGAQEGMLSVAFTPGFTLTATPASKTIVANGVMTVQRYHMSWGCDEFTCWVEPVADGAPVAVSVSSLGMTYPSFSTAATQFTATFANSGFVETSKVRVDFTNGAGSGITSIYDSSATLKSRIDALADGDPSNNDANLPRRMVIVLNNARMTAKNAATTDFSELTGTINLTLDQVDLPLGSGLTGTRKVAAPALVSVAGTFSSAAGESLSASVSLDLDDDLAAQAQALPDRGFLRGDFYQIVDEGSGSYVIHPPAGQTFWQYSYWLGTVDALRISLTPANGDNCRLIVIEPLNGTTPLSSPWQTGYCQPDSSTVLQALQASTSGLDAPLYWDMSVFVPNEGIYGPDESAFTATSIGAVLRDNAGDILQNESAYVRGAFSATLKLKLGGSANLDTEISVSGHRTSLFGGDVALQIKNNGKWLMLTGSGSDLRTASNLTLSNQDGVTLSISPRALTDSDSSNDEADLLLNGIQYGRLYQIAGAWVVRFSDNSFTML